MEQLAVDTADRSGWVCYGELATFSFARERVVVRFDRLLGEYVGRPLLSPSVVTWSPLGAPQDRLVDALEMAIHIIFK